MGWREAIGKHALSNSETLVQKVQNIQKVPRIDASVPFVPIVSRFENEKGYPIPDTEPEFAQDERRAIIDVDGGPQGHSMDVTLEPDRATVDGGQYSNDELADLLSRGLSAAEIQAVHETKRAFAGMVIRQGEAAEIESRAYPYERW